MSRRRVKVCMFVNNRVTNDPRVRREAAALAGAGYEVVVLGVAERPDDPPVEDLGGVTVRRLPRPSVMNSLAVPRLSPRAVLDAARDRALQRLSGAHPRFYGLLRDAYVGVRYGGALPPEVVALAAARAAEAAAGLAAAAEPTTTTTTTITEPPRPPTRRELFEEDLELVTSCAALNLHMARAATDERADVYHAHDLDTLLAGVLAKRRTGARLVYDFHELFPDQWPDGARTELWRGYYQRLERALIGAADAYVTVGDALARTSARTYGTPLALVLRNVPFLQAAPLSTPGPGPRVALYHGGYQPFRGLEPLIESARHLRHARLVMRGVGGYGAELRRLAARLGVEDRVTFAPPVPMLELVRSAREAEIGVCPFPSSCLNTYYAQPNKLYEYLMAGLAVVASDLPELRAVITSRRVGALCDPRDPRAIAAAIDGLAADPHLLAEARRNALRAATEELNWEVEQRKLLDLYARLVG